MWTDRPNHLNLIFVSGILFHCSLRFAQLYFSTFASHFVAKILKIPNFNLVTLTRGQPTVCSTRPGRCLSGATSQSYNEIRGTVIIERGHDGDKAMTGFTSVARNFASLLTGDTAI